MLLSGPYSPISPRQRAGGGRGLPGAATLDWMKARGCPCAIANTESARISVTVRSFRKLIFICVPGLSSGRRASGTRAHEGLMKGAPSRFTCHDLLGCSCQNRERPDHFPFSISDFSFVILNEWEPFLMMRTSRHKWSMKNGNWWIQV